MGNIFGSPEKISRKSQLFKVGVETLQGQGWKVERAPLGKSSVRKISRNGESKLISIRTTQDTWIAFPRSNDNKSWVTLSDVDLVLAVSVDSWESPKFAKVHMIDGAEMRDRFDRAYKARIAAGHSISVGQGVWVPLYINEDSTPSNVGGGAGLAHPPLKVVPLDGNALSPEMKQSPEVVQLSGDPPSPIQEAKRRLANVLGIDPSQIRISIDA